MVLGRDSVVVLVGILVLVGDTFFFLFFSVFDGWVGIVVRNHIRLDVLLFLSWLPLQFLSAEILFGARKQREKKIRKEKNTSAELRTTSTTATASYDRDSFRDYERSSPSDARVSPHRLGFGSNSSPFGGGAASNTSGGGLFGTSGGFGSGGTSLFACRRR